jgi:hypothetical protein
MKQQYWNKKQERKNVEEDFYYLPGKNSNILIPACRVMWQKNDK